MGILGSHAEFRRSAGGSHDSPIEVGGVERDSPRVMALGEVQVEFQVPPSVPGVGELGAAVVEWGQD